MSKKELKDEKKGSPTNKERERQEVRRDKSIEKGPQWADDNNSDPDDDWGMQPERKRALPTKSRDALEGSQNS